MKDKERRILLRAGLVLLCCWAFVATVGIVSLGLQGARNTTALDRSTHALVRSTAANLASQKALHDVEAQQSRLHEQLVQGCERLNIQRATANTAYTAEFNIDKLFVIGVSSAKPPPNATAQQRNLTRRFLADERSALHSIRWTPLTNCTIAVALKGSSYKAPRPITFSTRMPPASALSDANATKATPVDSIP